MRVEHIVRIVRADDTHLTLSREEAKEIYDALHAEFGDFDQARELSQLARESVGRELRLAKLEAEIDLGRGYSTRVPVVAAETGPSLQDDIEAMVAKNGSHTGIHEAPHDVVPASGAVAAVLDLDTGEITNLTHEADEWLGLEEFKPVDLSNTPEPPAEPETAPETPAPSNDQQVKMGRPRVPVSDQDRAVELWNRYRKRYPDEGLNRTVSRLCSHYPQPRPTADELREWLRAAGVDIPTPMSRSECAAQARDCRSRKPPEGYKVVNADAWKASESLLSDADIREMAEGGLARAGLALESGAVGW